MASDSITQQLDHINEEIEALGQKIEAAFNAIRGAPEVEKELLTENWRRLVKKDEALQAQRQTLSEALRGAAPAAGPSVPAAPAPGINIGTAVIEVLKEIAANTGRLLSDLKSSKHRYTTSHATQNRDPNFKASLIKAYSCQVPNPKDETGVYLRCMLLGGLFPSNAVCGGHLFKYEWREDALPTLGFKNINDPQNGLLLLKPLEEAFDSNYLIFLECDDVFTAHWLGNDLAQMHLPDTYPWSTKPAEKMDSITKKAFLDWANEKRGLGESLSFKSLDGKTLQFIGVQRPYKRCLSYQARKAVALAITEGRITDEWLIGKKLDFHTPEASMIEGYFRTIPPEGADPPVDSEQSD